MTLNIWRRLVESQTMNFSTIFKTSFNLNTCALAKPLLFPGMLDTNASLSLVLIWSTKPGLHVPTSWWGNEGSCQSGKAVWLNDRSEGGKKSHCFNWLPCTELSLLIMADLRTTGPNIKNPTYSWRYQRANKVDQDEASPAFRANLSLRRGGWESEQSFDRLQQESANYGPWAKSVLVPDFVNKALLKCLMLINSRTVYGSFAE